MGKVGFAPKDLVESGFGFERGRGRIVEIWSKWHQNPPAKKDNPEYGIKAGDQFPPQLVVQLGLVHVNEKLEAIDQEVKYVELPVMTKNQGNESPTPFSVGNAKDANDENPVDVTPNGVVVDATGNCIFARQDGIGINSKTKYGKFIKSMADHGFKAEVLGNGFLPDLIGTVAVFGEKAEEKWDGYTGTKDPTSFQCLETPIVFPYEQKGKGGAAAAKKPAPSAAGKPPAATAAAGSTAAPSTTTAPSNGSGGDDLQAIAIQAAQAVVADNAGKELDLKAFRTKIQQKLMKLGVKPPTLHPKVLELFKNDESLAAIGAESGGWMVDEEGKIVWAE